MLSTSVTPTTSTPRWLTCVDCGEVSSAAESEFSLDRVRSALGPGRSRLHSAHQVAKHAPLHPAKHRHWYHRVPPIVRIHSLYDLLRSFPTAESTVFSDADLADQFDAGR